MTSPADPTGPACAHQSTRSQQALLSPDQLRARIDELGPWFHNLDLFGVLTAPDHPLGDYPRFKWERFAHAIDPDLSGKSVLDIGCNAGFHAIEMKRRGASRVVAIDIHEGYLRQARWVAEILNMDIELHQLSVYDIASLNERFDLVLFMGVLYHLRYPLYALDLIRSHVVADTLICQSMIRGSGEVPVLAQDHSITETAIFERPGYPAMYFVEHAYAGDPSNWWIPNRAAMEAMLRSAGFHITAHPEAEVYICRLA